MVLYDRYVQYEYSVLTTHVMLPATTTTVGTLLRGDPLLNPDKRVEFGSWGESWGIMGGCFSQQIES